MARTYSRNWDNDGELLKQFPAEVLAMKDLTELELYGCFVQTKRIEIPSKLGTLKQLRTLRLGMARIDSLPETLGNLTKLVELNLSSAETLRSL